MKTLFDICSFIYEVGLYFWAEPIKTSRHVCFAKKYLKENAFLSP